MTRKKVVRLLFLPLLVALLSVGPALAQEEEVPPDITAQAALGSAFTYQGHLLDGTLPANGTYDFEFKLYDGADPATAAQKGSTITMEDVAVTSGNFTVSLDFGSSPFNGQALWLQVGVRPGASTDPFTPLSPLTGLNAAPYALGLMPGASISRDYAGTTLSVLNGWPGGLWVVLKSAITAWTSDGVALIGNAGTGTGVSGGSTAGIGVNAWSRGTTREQAALRANNSNATHGIAAYITNNSDYHTAHFANSGTGGVLYLQNAGDAAGAGGGDFITARNSAENDSQFRVLSDGRVLSDVGFNTPAADFAEMLPAEDGLEPGDLLAIGPDGTLVRAVGAYSTAVAGVYSTQPGFVGGYEEEGNEGEVPLAIMGAVPTKASAKNGAILPGDLLVASDTPGYVMKGTDRDLMLGAVVGKALSGLESGVGSINVLVTLQ